MNHLCMLIDAMCGIHQFDQLRGWSIYTCALMELASSIIECCPIMIIDIIDIKLPLPTRNHTMRLPNKILNKGTAWHDL